MTHIDPPRSPDLGRLRRLALCVRSLCLLGLALCAAVPVYLWAQPELLIEMVRTDWGIGDRLLQTDLTARSFGLLAISLPAGMLAYVLWQVWALFGGYAQGQVLTLRAAQQLRRAAVALTALGPSLPLSKALCLLALTLGNPPGERLLHLSISMQDYLSLLSGLVLLAIASVMREAVRLAEENAEFI